MQHKKSISIALALFLTLQVLSGSMFAAGKEGSNRISANSTSTVDTLLSAKVDFLHPTEEYASPMLETKTDNVDPSSLNASTDTSQSLMYRSDSTVTQAVYVKQPLPAKPSPSLELPDERTSNTKTYQLQDDSYETIISTEALHYQDKTGDWQDISLLLTDEAEIANQLDVPLSRDALPEVPVPETTDSKGKLRLSPELSKLNKDAFRALQVPFDVRISKQFSKGYEIGKGSDRLSFVPVGASSSRAVVQQDVYGNSLIRYPSAWTATDVTLQLMANGMKESILLASKAAPSSFSYEVSSGLSKELQLGELQIEPAWLIDAVGTYRDVPQTLRNVEGKTYLDLLPDLSGLVYPVTLDPTVVLKSANNETKDTTLNAHEPDRNYGTDPRLYTGKDVNGNHFRTLLQFDLSQIPAGEYTVLDAYLTLNQTAEYQYNASTEVKAQRVTGTWEENTVNWNNQPVYAANIDGLAYSTVAVVGEGAQVFYLKELVSEWVNGLYPNYGIELQADNITAPNVKKYVSANTSAATQHPSLTLHYTMPNQTWNGVTSSADSLTSFNQKKIDYTSDGYQWMLVRDGGDFRLDGMKPEENTWFHSGTHALGAANGSMYIDQDNYLHLAYTSVSGGIKYVRGTYNTTAHRWTLSTPVVISTDVTMNVPDLVAHRALTGGGWTVHIVSSKHSTTASTNGAVYNRIDISASGAVGTLAAAVLLDSGTKGVPTWPSIDFQHTPSAIDHGKAVKDGAPNLYVAWNAGDAGTGLGIRYKQATFSAGNWTWAGEQAVDENQYTTTDRDWFLSVYDGSRSVVFGALRNTANQKSLLAYTMQTTSKKIDMFYSALAEGKQALYGSGSYDAQGNLYFAGLSGVAGDFITFKWSRAAQSLSLPKQVTPHLGSSYATMKRGDNYNTIELATSTQSGADETLYDIEHSVILDTIEREFTQYSYDAASRLNYILLQNGDGIAFTYDSAGNLTHRQLDEQPDTNGTNLVINGSFEVTEHTPGTAPGITDPHYGWNMYTVPGSTASFEPVDLPVSRGNKALKLEVSQLPQSQSDFVYQTVGVTGNQPFRLSGKVYKQALSQASAVLSVEFLSGDLTVLGSYEQESTGVKTSYETLQKKGWIPAGTVYAKVYVKVKALNANASGTVFADAITLEYTDDNLLWNPGFERTKSGQLIEWGTYTAPGSTVVFLPVSDAYEGASAIKLSASLLPTGAYSFVHQTKGIGAGETYALSANYKAENLSSAVGVLAVQFFDGSGNSLGWIEQTGTASGNYNPLELHGVAPAGAVYIKYMIGLKGTGVGGQGNVFIDNAKLKVTQP
ncbi:DNRLRE domain-containing protein [Paenibacillus sp. 19GGS1-52]|uniref:DNRLRE domain-containing protein n=1 Tax=Paenibacillus sp. 19GGS1-52 TaxID=2758563 RepID=UPI001EFB581F|nr:DNRLRE domain-containing protein [Paenibacillus sp. 19GGS1-52]ULO07145.1 DNRLRE domain-containing protein [Paenibacillus sp. 19GGS1-52]